jgi:hypothetical protein
MLPLSRIGAALPRRSDWRWALPHLGALAFCLLIAVIATYPIVAQLRTHIAGSAEPRDAVCFVWNNWWMHRAITELQKPYFTDLVLAPFRPDLRLHTLGLLYGLMAVPFLPLLGPVAVVNAQLLATPVLNGYAGFLLVRKLVGRNDVAILCGAVLAGAPAVGFHLAMGRPSCAALWPVLLTLLFLTKLIERPDAWNSLGLAASLLAVLLADQQMTVFCGLLVLLYLVFVAATRVRVLMAPRLLGAAALVLLSVAYPFFLLYVRPFFQTAGYTVPHPSEAFNYSIPPGMLLHPGHLWRTYGVLLPCALVAALVIVRRDRRAVLGILCSLIFLSLTLGPVLSGTTIPMPFAGLRLLPGFSQFRTPYRFQIPAAVGMTLCLGVVLSHILSSIQERRLGRASLASWVVGGLAVLVVVDTVIHRTVSGFQTQTFRDEPIYRTIGDTPGDFLVLEVPFGVRSGTDVLGRGDDLTYYQPVHKKRMINVLLTRIPLASLEHYRRSPALMFLGNEPYSTTQEVADDFAKIVESLRVGFVVVHPERLDADRFDEISRFLQARPELQPVATGTTTLAFRVHSMAAR